MDRGILIIKTPYSSGDLKVKWKKVKSIKSTQSFFVSATDGKRYKLHELDTNNPDNHIVLNDDKGSVEMSDIVFFRQVKVWMC